MIVVGLLLPRQEGCDRRRDIGIGGDRVMLDRTEHAGSKQREARVGAADIAKQDVLA